jgi:cardiolipin synthase
MTAVRTVERAGARDDCSREVRRTLEGVLGVPATEGNQIDVLRNGDEIFPSMLDAIAGAEHTIDFLTFVYWAGDIGTVFAKALAERARAGVRVRLLLDALGARTMDRDLIDLMDDHGVQVRWFRPLRKFRPGQVNHRTHRKVLIVDEAVGFSGGVGIADEWQGDARNEHEWRDTHFRFEGPIVDGLRAAFLDNWAETDPVLYEAGVDRFPEQPQPGHAVTQCIRGASETGWSDVATLMRTLLQMAEDHVRITTAYFVPDEELISRLCDAADRGVDVDVLIPGPFADKRVVQLAAETSYARLLDHGVSIWNYQPTMLHAKIMTVDGRVANIGSANLNRRSLSFDEEINIVALDPALVSILDDHFEEDVARSVRLQPGRWELRSLTQRTVEQLVVPLRRFF